MWPSLSGDYYQHCNQTDKSLDNISVMLYVVGPTASAGQYVTQEDGFHYLWSNLSSLGYCSRNFIYIVGLVTFTCGIELSF